MGRGPRHGNDPPMSKARDLPGEVEDPSIGTSGGLVAVETPEVCEAKRELSFLISSHTDLSIGDGVSLQAGQVVAVVSGGRQVGELAAADSRAVTGCISFGYRMRGVVASLDDAAGTGFLMITGERA